MLITIGVIMVCMAFAPILYDYYKQVAHNFGEDTSTWCQCRHWDIHEDGDCSECGGSGYQDTHSTF